MGELICPYCGEECMISFESDGGKEENTIYHHRCDLCGNNFVFTARVIITHKAVKAPCQNGGEHDLEDVRFFPDYHAGMKRCKVCWEEVVVDEVAHKAAREALKF